MDREIKVVIGASYGDEGKGLMTDHFCEKADKPCITVLHNGGSQRGHTVMSENGFRHVFHHLSSGTFAGSDTYFADSFIINPLVFVKEHQELSPDTKIFCSANCMWSTPFDMIVNQVIEDSRGNNRHGSCGYGIWETIVRYGNSKTINFPDFIAMDRQNQVKYLKHIRDYYMAERLKNIGIKKVPFEWEEIVYDYRIIQHFLDDCNYFGKVVEIINPENNKILNEYRDIIFEGGQGLLLNQDEKNPHTTPSFTGAENPVKLIRNISGEKNIEVCYVTRSYLTRHGAGNFPGECAKSEINPDMIDKTNVPNDYQGTLRYGKININELIQRVSDDFGKFSEFENTEISLAITHLNETNGKLFTDKGLKDPECIGIDKIYCSYSEKMPS